ncbi:MAG: hypothetical protein KDA81_12590 [Planctomycetaceae bacterium]|nr:hypothetical protein [Planctomycetaceae bacterium]
MAGKYDPRVDSLVMETRTLWDSTVGDLSPEDRRWVSREIHQHPELASNITYDRTHTGFARIITVTLEDIQKLYVARQQA